MSTTTAVAVAAVATASPAATAATAVTAAAATAATAVTASPAATAATATATAATAAPEWRCSVRDPWFTYLGQGRKIFEVRKAGSVWKDAVAGTVLEVVDPADSRRRFRMKIVDVMHFKGPAALADCLKAVGLENALPGVPTVERGVEVYLGFGWSREEIAAHGVLAFRVAKLGD